MFAISVQISVACMAEYPHDEGNAGSNSQARLIEPVYLETPEFDAVPVPPRWNQTSDDRPTSRENEVPRATSASADSGGEVGAGVEEVAAETWLEPSAQTQQLGPEYAPSIVACPDREWTYQFLPDGLMFQSFLAGEKEPRFASVWLNDPDRGTIWETALGGRIGVYRYGTQGAVKPEGWQLDLEGGVLTRLDWEEQEDVDAADFVIGIIMTRRVGPTAIEFGYSHISSHVGDEFLVKNPGFQRVNYVRDSVLFGLSYDVTTDVRVYGEVAYAPGPQGGAEPLEFQTGAEYSPSCCHIAPFAGVNLHFRQEFGFQSSVNIVAGLQLRGETSNRLLRVGLQHYNGKALQYSFFDENEQLTGGGLWVDY